MRPEFPSPTFASSDNRTSANPPLSGRRDIRSSDSDSMIITYLPGSCRPTTGHFREAKTIEATRTWTIVFGEYPRGAGRRPRHGQSQGFAEHHHRMRFMNEVLRGIVLRPPRTRLRSADRRAARSSRILHAGTPTIKQKSKACRRRRAQLEAGCDLSEAPQASSSRFERPLRSQRHRP